MPTGHAKAFFLRDLALTVSYFVLFLVGLDAAGKTTILYKLKLGEIVTTIPTIGKTIDIMSGKLSLSILTDIAHFVWHIIYAKVTKQAAESFYIQGHDVEFTSNALLLNLDSCIV